MIALPKFRFPLPDTSVFHCAVRLLAAVFSVAGMLLLSGCVTLHTDAPEPAMMLPAAAVTGGVTAAPGTVTPADLPTASSVIGRPAEIILYAQTEEGVFILAGDHSFPILRGWAGFGGAADEGETLAQTAARETEEETRGYFRRGDLLPVLQEKTPLFSHGIAFFFVKVDKIPVEDIANMSVAGKGIAYSERGPFTWIPYGDIDRYLDRQFASARGYTMDKQNLPSKGWHTSWIWPIWLNHFRVARDAGALPWEQPEQGGE